MLHSKYALAGAVFALFTLSGCGTFDTVVEKTSELVKDTKALVKKALPRDGLDWPSGEGVRNFTIDDEASEVVMRVYRAGRLSKFGHNHVIQAKGLRGRAAVTSDLEDSAFELQTPLAQWEIDDPDLRARSGKDFETKPSKEDIQGTRSNMMGEKGLEADKFPVLSMSGNFEQGDDGQVLNASIRLHGVDHELTIPASLVISGNEMRVIGNFHINQSDFGIKPLSLLFGALRVRDEVEVRFSLVLIE
ncbi:MAG: YceI family protein [Gammaproteobacteria bacterium]